VLASYGYFETKNLSKIKLTKNCGMCMKLVMKDVTSARVVDERLYVALGSNERSCRIATLGDNGSTKNVASLSGPPCNLLLGFRDNLLVSAGNILYIVSNNGAKPVLRARHGNWFWHVVEACGKVFVQEYGESPTGIYVSEDLEDFKLLVSSKDMDPLSRHFHYIAFDEERRVLITTLSNGNIVWVVILTECEYSWKPLYKGLWRFVSVLVEEDRMST